MRKSVAALGSAISFPLGPGTFVGLIPYLVTRWRCIGHYGSTHRCGHLVWCCSLVDSM